MKKTLISTLFWLVFCASAEAQKLNKIQWKNWRQLEQALKKEPKPVFLFFEAEWCAYCKKINREVFTKKSVINILNSSYYALKMDVESTKTVRFDGIDFINEQAKTKRNAVHQLPLLLATREKLPFSLPATIILNKDFTVRQRIFQYYTTTELLKILD